MSGGSNGSSSVQPTSTTVNNVSIPAYAQPYVESTLGQASALTNINQNPYQAYQGQQVAGFSPLQTQAFNNISNQQVAPQITDASNLAYAVGQGGLDAFNTAGQLQNQATSYGAQGAQGAFDNAALSNQYGTQGQQSGLTGQGLGIEGGGQYGAVGAGYGSQGADIGTTGGAYYGGQGMGYGAQGADIGTAGGTYYGGQGMGYGAQGAGLAGTNLGLGALGTQQGLSYGRNAQNPNAVQSYMNPYLQATLAPAQQLLNKQYDMQGAQEQGVATSAGAFGGSREALMQGLNQQNRMLAQNQLVGNAYNQAYNTANQNMQQAAQLGMQGAGVGIQGVSGANQNYATGIQGANTGLQGVNTQLAGTAQGMQGANTGLQGVNTQLAGTAQGMQGAQVGLQGVDRQLAGTAQGMQGAQLGLQGANQAGQLYVAGAQTGISGVNAATSAGQYGLQGLNTSGQAASTLGNLGQTQFNQENAINQNMLSAGTQQQQLQQQGLNTAYNNYQTQLNYPYQQLAFMQGMYQGLPLSQSASNMYQAAPSLGSTALGLGTAGIGAAKLMGRKGGATKDFEVRKMASGGIASGVPAAKLDSMLGRLDDQQLVQKTDPKLNDPQTAQAAQSEMNFRQQMRNPGIGAAPATNMNNLAGGGIVAFADAGQVKEEPPEETSKAPEAGQKVTLDQILSGGPTKEALQTSAANIKDIVGENTAGKGLLDYLERRQAEGAGDKEKQSAMRFIQAGLGMMGGTSPYAAVNIGQGAAPAVQGAIQDAQEQHKEELANAKARFDVENTSYQDKLNIAKMAKEDLQKTREALTHIYGYQSAADSAIKAAGINANSHVAVAKYNADRAETLETTRATHNENLEKLRKSGDMGNIMYTNILGKMTNGHPDKATWEQKADASTQAVTAMHPSYGPQQQNANIFLEKTREQYIDNALVKNGLFMLSPNASEKDKQRHKDITKEAGTEFDAQFNGNKQNSGKGADTPTANGLPPTVTKDGVTYVLQPNGKYVVK